MTTLSRELPETPAGVLARLRENRAERARLEAEDLALAARWADLHPDPAATGGPVPVAGSSTVSWLETEIGADPEADPLIPGMAWDAGAVFAAALGRSTSAGEGFIRDALVLRHRLPALWRRVHAGRVPAYRARKVAQAVYAQPADVAAYLDHELTPIAHKAGQVTLERVLDEAWLRLHPEERELEQLQALGARHATLHQDSIGHTGVAEMTLRAEWADLVDFDQALSQVAAVLKTHAETDGVFVESLDVRRAQAVGILAHPETAAALLAGATYPATDTHEPTRGWGHVPVTRQLELVVHLSAADLETGGDPLARLAAPGVGGVGRPVLAQQVQALCGNPHLAVTVRPVLDLEGHRASTAYETPSTLRAQVGHLAAGHCTFPWCTRPATRCDLDHATPHAQGGATCSCNLHPLCRRHHRLKTHTPWTVQPVEPGVWHWTDPHGHRYRRDPDGTTDLPPPTSDEASTTTTPDADTGCWWQPPNTLHDTA